MNEEHLKIKEQIQKSFLVLKKCLEQWKEASERTNKFLEKVADFADQYQCCAKVRVTDLEIARTFPDLQERLLFRIASESDRLFTQLRKQLDVMKDCCEKVTRQYDVSIKTYQKLSSSEDLPAICSRTATSPSITDTLEWLQISEQLLWQQYRCKEQLIKMFKLSDEASVEMFTKEWTVGDKNALDQIQGFLCYTSFILEDKT